MSDGAVLKVYEAANKQMFEQNVDKSQYPAALSFLIGGGKLADTFNFELYEGAAMNFPGGHVLVGTPKTPTPAYPKVLFYVDGADVAGAARAHRRRPGQPQSLRLRQPEGQRDDPPGPLQVRPAAGHASHPAVRRLSATHFGRPNPTRVGAP